MPNQKSHNCARFSHVYGMHPIVKILTAYNLNHTKLANSEKASANDTPFPL